MSLDPDVCRRAVRARDARFDGMFVAAVRTTGIYCRPSCPARPLPGNLRFFPTAAAAQVAGFRACKRCRPDATPGSPEWDRRADAAGRAMRLIADGVVDREGVAGLARRLSWSERHLRRMLVAEVGASPQALARSQRAQAARVLLETTDLPVTDAALAAGFGSLRQFNATIRQVFAATPSELRRQARRGGSRPGDPLTLRLPYRAPLAAATLLGFLGARAVPGVEEVVDGGYRRSLRLPHGPGVVELRPSDGFVSMSLWLHDLRDVTTAVQRCRNLLDLDGDPQAVDQALGRDPLLRPMVAASPGVRVAGHVDGAELAVRAVLGQQVTVAGATALAARLARDHGEPLARPVGAVTHLFPTPAALADAAPGTLAMPAGRRRALLGLARALASGELVLDAGADRHEALARLRALPGVGPWTASYVALRALRDPDAFLPTDLGVRRALERLGADGSPRSIERAAEAWRPYRAYATQLLWAQPPTAFPKRAAS